MPDSANHDEQVFSRRAFLKTTATPAAGGSLAQVALGSPHVETLAVAGGERTVAVPDEEQAALSRWPRYGDAEKKELAERNALVARNIREVNGHLIQLAGVSEPRVRPDQTRVYYNGNLLFIDFTKAGVTRPALVKALQSEGVHAKYWDYPEQHKMQLYAEAKWWHPKPTIPESMPGNAAVNSGHIFLPAFYGEAAELNAQYVRAFEKVWAHRTELA